MEQPPGFEEPGKENWVWQLQKSIYGMKQDSRIWNQTFHKVVTSWGFKRMRNEWCVYRRSSSTGTTIFALHVDDIIVTSSFTDEMDRFKAELRSQWEISDLRPAKFALGIAIMRDLADKSITISQATFIDRILKRSNLSDAHPVDLPLIVGVKLTHPDKSLPITAHLAAWVTRTLYHELVSRLNYLAVA